MLEIWDPHSQLCEEMAGLNLSIVYNIEAIAMEIDSTLEKDIREGQKNEEKCLEIKRQIKVGKAPDFRVDEQGTVWLGKRICVPDVKEIWELILVKLMTELIYTSRQYEDVPRPQGSLLVAWYEV